MKRRSEPSLKLQVNLPASLKREVELRADAAGQTLSSWVQRLIASHIKTTEAAIAAANIGKQFLAAVGRLIASRCWCGVSWAVGPFFARAQQPRSTFACAGADNVTFKQPGRQRGHPAAHVMSRCQPMCR